MPIHLGCACLASAPSRKPVTGSGLYDATSLPLVSGRVASLPLDVALGVYGAPDPIAAAKDVFSGNAFARQALASASPSLARAVQGWVAGGSLRNPKTPLRAFAYLVRMAARPTPLGLCAGVGNVQVGKHSTLALDESSRRSFTRPDMQLMLKLAEKLENAQRPQVRYVTNSSALERGGRLYIVDPALSTRSLEEPRMAVTEQRPISLKNTGAVRFVREFCRKAQTHASIVMALAERFIAPVEVAAKLLDRLIEAGVVFSELRPSPIGDPVAYLCARFVALGASFAPELTRALRAAEALDATDFARRSDNDYLRVHDACGALLDEPPPNTLQIDLRTGFSGALASGVLADAALLAELYVRCGPTLSLAKLRRRFEERFEGGERVLPLLELVDQNLGLGVPEDPERVERDVSKRDALLTSLACDALRVLPEEIVLDRDQAEILFPEPERGAELPAALEVGFAIAASSLEELEASSYLVVPTGFVASVGEVKSVGRFAKMFDGEVFKRMRALARSTCDPEDLTAELAFASPDARSYNVYIRPRLYDYEIRVGIGQESSSDEISASDLWVGLDDGRFVLWSAAHASRVSVRESHLFATTTATPNLCRFLALLESDGRRVAAGFTWGPASGLRYLPRVRVGRVVLSPRTWSFERAALGKEPAAAARTLARWRTDWKMPRYVLLTESDNRLLVDLDSPVAADLVLDQTKGSALIFHEMLPSPEQTWLRGTAGAHVVEFIASARCMRERRRREKRPAPALLSSRVRHGPGSAWTYGRLYLGTQAVDDHLLSEIAPLVEALRGERLVDRWFFLRYADPHSQLRLRLRASDGNSAAVRERFLASGERWLRDQQVSRYSLDTYDPEYERYGGVAMTEAIERFFEFDSDQALVTLRADSASTGALVCGAARTFDALIRSAALFDQIVLRAFEHSSKQRLNSDDRAAFKRLAANPNDVAACALGEALGSVSPEIRLRDLLHMHCNRLGLQGDGEVRVAALVRALALRRVALHA